jgi:hypothetical protein
MDRGLARRAGTHRARDRSGRSRGELDGAPARPPHRRLGEIARHQRLARRPLPSSGSPASAACASRESRASCPIRKVRYEPARGIPASPHEAGRCASRSCKPILARRKDMLNFPDEVRSPTGLLADVLLQHGPRCRKSVVGGGLGKVSLAECQTARCRAEPSPRPRRKPRFPAPPPPDEDGGEDEKRRVGGGLLPQLDRLTGHHKASAWKRHVGLEPEGVARQSVPRRNRVRVQRGTWNRPSAAIEPEASGKRTLVAARWGGGGTGAPVVPEHRLVVARQIRLAVES